ncbi:hypothetical protein SERLA73DRAFT_175019, partial [Serpula lacrymans var. lacrymans S7.3]
MRQSLQASREAQNVKKVDDQLNKERVLQVLKSSSSGSSGSSRTRSASPSKYLIGRATSGSEEGGTSVPPLPLRRKASFPSSTTSSRQSLDQIAGATLPSPSKGNFRPALPSREPAPATTDSSPSPLPTLPAPPMHPDRRSSSDVPDSIITSSPNSPRVFRSKSMHHPSPPVPPPRRRRPESVQLTPASSSTELPTLVSQGHARAPSY